MKVASRMLFAIALSAVLLLTVVAVVYYGTIARTATGLQDVSVAMR